MIDSIERPYITFPEEPEEKPPLSAKERVRRDIETVMSSFKGRAMNNAMCLQMQQTLEEVLLRSLSVTVTQDDVHPS